MVWCLPDIFCLCPAMAGKGRVFPSMILEENEGPFISGVNYLKYHDNTTLFYSKRGIMERGNQEDQGSMELLHLLAIIIFLCRFSSSRCCCSRPMEGPCPWLSGEICSLMSYGCVLITLQTSLWISLVLGSAVE